MSIPYKTGEMGKYFKLFEIILGAGGEYLLSPILAVLRQYMENSKATRFLRKHGFATDNHR